MVFLIDSASLYVRAYYASIEEEPLKSNGSGKYFNAVDYFLQFCKSFRDKRKPDDRALFCWESPQNWRKVASPMYKSNRPPMPEDLKFQIPYIKRVPALFGFKSWENDGKEADDLIAYVCSLEKDEIFIISGDKDFAGLLRSGVVMRDPLNSKELRNSAWVKKTFGVTWDQFYFFQGLTGDSADCVTGVPGIGPVAAKKIVEAYKTPDNLIKNWNLASNAFPKLKGQEGAFSDSYELVNLNLDIPVERSKKPPMKLEQANSEGIRSFIAECRDV